MSLDTDRAERTGLPGHDSAIRGAMLSRRGSWRQWRGQLGQKTRDRDRRVRTGHLEPDSWDRTGETGRTRQVGLTGTWTGQRRQGGKDTTMFGKANFREKKISLFRENVYEKENLLAFSRKCSAAIFSWKRKFP